MRELWVSRRILFVLTQRLLKIRYRQTLLGVLWVVVQPVVLTVILVFFFGLIGRGDRYGMPFVVFIFSGLAFFRVVAKVASEGSGSIVGNASILERVYLPRAHMLLAIAVSSLTDLVINTVLLLGLVLLYGLTPGPGMVTLPLLLVVLYATALGVAFPMAALNVRYRDVQLVMPLLTQAWFFASPILYAPWELPEPVATLYYLNPMALVIDGARWALTGSPAPPPAAWLLSISMAGVLLVTGYLFFRRRDLLLVDELP